MICLLIDTATERGIIALSEGDAIIKEVHLPFGLHNSHALFFELDQLFRSTGVDKRSLQCVICGSGPGSYTGMRVAAASAKSLSFALQIPLIGVPTTTGLVPSGLGPYAAIIDAKISGSYVQKAIKSAVGIEYISSPEIVALNNLKEYLGDISTLVSPKIEILKQKIVEGFVWEEKGLSARDMIVAALKRKECLSLLYLRKTQAELQIRS